jgi:Tfp pilus assembly protein PilO
MLTEGDVGIIAVLASVIVTLANNFLYFGKKLEKLDRLEAEHKKLKNDYKEIHDELIALRTKFDICSIDNSV